MRLYNYLNETMDDVEQIISKMSDISLPGKKPKDVNKTDWEILKEIRELSNSILLLRKKGDKQEIDLKMFSLKVKLDQLRIDIDDIINKLQSNNKSDKITKNNHTYLKMANISENKFKSFISDLESFFKSLKGFHNKVTKNLTIKFVDGTKQKTAAKYIEKEDSLQVNINKIGKTKEEYGSLRYVILHELGHRFLKMYPQKWDYTDNKWITTKYSGIDSWSDEEKFAELFAMSHWENKYSQFSDKIEKFKQLIN